MWTENLPIAIPSEHRDIANRAAFLFDPDQRGDLTFHEGGDVIVIKTQLKQDFVPMFERPRNVENWYNLLKEKAIQKGVEPLTQEEVALLCEELLFHEECDPYVEQGNS